MDDIELKTLCEKERERYHFGGKNIQYHLLGGETYQHVARTQKKDKTPLSSALLKKSQMAAYENEEYQQQEIKKR